MSKEPENGWRDLLQGVCFFAAFTIIGLGFAWFLAFVTPAYPHSWYEPDCCNERDCAPAEPGQVSLTTDGYEVKTKNGTVLMPYNDPRIRPSRDGEYHPCIVPSSQRLLCLYVPAGV